MLSVKGLFTEYPNDRGQTVKAAQDVAFEVPEGKLFTLLGPSPRDIYERPRNAFVADFVGASNFIDATVLGPLTEAGAYRVTTALGDLEVRSVDTLAAQDKAVIAIRPEDVALSEQPPAGGQNACQGKVEAQVFLGECMDFQVRVGETLLLARAHPSMRAPVGGTLHITMNPEKCIAIPNSESGATT